MTMRLLVCIKQVPDPDALAGLEGAAGGPERPAAAAFRISRYDEYALEEALRVKEGLAAAPQGAGRPADVDVVSAGPERAAEALRRAVGMGAGRGIHLLAEAGPDLPAPAVSERIVEVIRRGDYDLVLCGVMSEDLMQGQVGPMIAARLDWPCATAAVTLRVRPDTHRVDVEREVEGGARERVEIGLPAVLTVQSGINRPRYPSLSNLLRANRQALETQPFAAGPSAPGVSTGPQWRFVHPQKSRSALMLAGSRSEKAVRLAEILRQRALLPGSGHGP
jgi:electron transfer flavoprotein beta subunit